MLDKIQDTNQNLNSEQKPKNFWQKLKVWQKIGIILFALLLIYIIIIPLLFCTNMDFDFSKNPKYVSCSQDSDCNAKTCGCLNKEGAKKFSLWSIFCGIKLLCIIPSSCSCQNGQCVSNFDYGNETQKKISSTTDKTEYQTGEEVKFTVENSLDEEIEFYNIAVERFNNIKWEQVRLDIEDFGFGEKMQTVINSQNDKSFLWDQKDNGLQQVEAGKYKFRIGVWDNAWNGNGIPPMFNHYSNEFTIKDSVVGPPLGNIVCSQDSDCEINYADYCCGKWEGCFNKYDNPGTIGDLNDPDCKCVKREPIRECKCINNVCQPVYDNKGTENSNKIIQDLIQQMGDDNVSQKIKYSIPEKLYGYGKEAIPYLIEALDDERVFDPCFHFLSSSIAYDDDDCQKYLVKSEAMAIVKRIITPSPYPKTASTDKGYRFSYRVNNWQQWWEENQNKSLNEIRKMVRDYYRNKEAKDNYSGIGYSGEEYDYLDIVGDLAHDNFLLKFEEVCTGFNNLKQVDYLEWPIKCGCLSVNKHICYQHFAEYHKNASVCDKITWNVFGRDNCYWAVAIELNKAGMNNKIDFCGKIEDVGIENHARRKACFKMAE